LACSDATIQAYYPVGDTRIAGAGCWIRIEMDPFFLKRPTLAMHAAPLCSNRAAKRPEWKSLIGEMRQKSLPPEHEPPLSTTARGLSLWTAYD